MERVLSSKPLVAVTAAIWLAAYAAWTADWLVYAMPHLLERSLLRLPLCALGIGLCFAMVPLLARGAEAPFGRRLLFGTGLCLGSAIIYAAASMVLFRILFPLWDTMITRSILLDGVEAMLSILWVFIAWTAAAFGVLADAAARDGQQRLAAMDVAVQKARHAALASQVQPHFLFNALNAVSGLLLTGETQRAERLTMALSGLLRRSIEASDSAALVPLAEELEAVNGYLEVELVRFEDRLDVEIAVDPGLETAPVPPMLLQPLVENAIKHGVSRTESKVDIRISAHVEGEKLILEVRDNASPLSAAPVAPGTGFGHRSISERLSLAYGAGASFEAVRLEGAYVSRVTLPFP